MSCRKLLARRRRARRAAPVRRAPTISRRSRARRRRRCASPCSIRRAPRSSARRSPWRSRRPRRRGRRPPTSAARRSSRTSTPGKYMLHVESAGFEAIDVARRQRAPRPPGEARSSPRDRQVRRRGRGDARQDRRSAERQLLDRAHAGADRRAARRRGGDGSSSSSRWPARARCCASTASRAAGCRRSRRSRRSASASIRTRPRTTSRASRASTSARGPGNGNWRNSASFTFRDESLNARNAFADEKGAEQARRYQWSIDGPIVKGKTSFSLFVGGLSSYDSQTILAAGSDRRGPRPGHAAERSRQPQRARRARDHEEPDAARRVLAQQQRPVEPRRRRLRPLRARLRARAARTTSSGCRRADRSAARCATRCASSSTGTTPSSTSASDDVTIRVQDAFRTAARRRRRRPHARRRSSSPTTSTSRSARSTRCAPASLVEGGWYRGDESRNYIGTFTFSDLDAYDAQRPLQFRSARAIRSSSITSVASSARYINDDIRVRKNLMMSLGLRARSADAPRRQR